MSKLRKSTKRTMTSYVLTFLLMVVLIAVSLIAFVKYSMLSERAILYTCSRISYYDDLTEEITNISYQMGIPFGVEKKNLKGVFSPDQVEKDMRGLVHSMIEGQEYTIDTSAIENKITKNIENANENLDANQKESVQVYVKSVADLYTKKVNIPGLKNIINACNTWTTVTIVGLPICALLIIILVFALISMRYYLYHGLRTVAYSVLGAGITLITVFSACISNGFIYRLNISDAFMRKFFTFFVGHEMLIQVFSGIGMIIIGVVIIIVIIRQRARGRE